LETIAFILSVFGNLMVCYVMIYKTKLVGFSSRFILSMSIADMLIGLVAIPTAVFKVSI
jgi:7 transmembrane receptor (rhodopsin family)